MRPHGIACRRVRIYPSPSEGTSHGACSCQAARCQAAHCRPPWLSAVPPSSRRARGDVGCGHGVECGHAHGKSALTRRPTALVGAAWAMTGPLGASSALCYSRGWEGASCQRHAQIAPPPLARPPHACQCQCGQNHRTDEAVLPHRPSGCREASPRAEFASRSSLRGSHRHALPRLQPLRAWRGRRREEGAGGGQAC